MSNLFSVCVYCGSGPGARPEYMQYAEALGAELAKNGLRLVYGGGASGLMGQVARSTLKHGGLVTGIIPEFLEAKEGVVHEATEVIVTNDMHTRKRLMFEKADAFVAMPGGIGTLEELTEMLTWAQLAQHKKPILIANFDGFWNPLLKLFDHMLEEQFIRPGLMITYLLADHVEEIVPKLREWSADICDTEVMTKQQRTILEKLS